MKASLACLIGLTTRALAWSNAWKAQYGDIELSLPGHQHIPVGPDDGRHLLARDATGNAYFKQIIDHKNPDKGSFNQFYYWSTQYWKGPGSPVILMTPGEVNATGYDSYLTTSRLTGVLGQKLGAAIIVLEHRYWGNSSPFPDLTTANLQYLTLENSIADLNYFANNFQSPWSNGLNTTAKDVPWVMVGGSYSGALSAWTEATAPGTYWAYHASSAPVQAISDYAAYFYPVQQGMPPNCSKDINTVINYMDGVLTSGSQVEVQKLKAMFKLQDVSHNDDFMAALEWGPWLWQSNQFYTGHSPFFQFCDYIENAINSTTPVNANGVGLQKALQGYADWFTTQLLPNFCSDTFGYAQFQGELNTKCFDTYDKNSPLFADRSLSNTYDRQWDWMLCNEPFGYWQDGAPTNHPTLVSRLVNAKYWIRQCDLWFPPGPNGETYGIAKGRTEARVNAYTKGWDQRQTTRLLYTNGGYDPWRECGVSADIRPGGPMKSTAQTPINVVPGGFHCSDLITKNGQANAGTQNIIDSEVNQIATWVSQWKKGSTGGGYGNGGGGGGGGYGYGGKSRRFEA